jgi:hypothetical protein
MTAMPTVDPSGAVAALDPLDDEQLFAELGTRLQINAREPQLSGQFTVAAAPKQLEALGPIEDLRNFGKRFFARVNRQAYGLVCGADPENQADREQLADALKLGKEAFAATLTSLLMAYLGLAPLIAPVVAMLIVRLFFHPAYGAMCDVWKQKLGPAAP